MGCWLSFANISAAKSNTKTDSPREHRGPDDFRGYEAGSSVEMINVIGDASLGTSSPPHEVAIPQQPRTARITAIPEQPQDSSVGIHALLDCLHNITWA